METELITDARETEKRPEKMKYQLADALKQCMSKMPVEKITVKEIVEECGTTRQTFYRNFKDKYDLINWYFDKILLESFEHMGEGRTVYEGLVNKFYYIEDERLFFKAAFQNDAQNSLREHDFHLILSGLLNYKHKKTDKSGKEKEIDNNGKQNHAQRDILSRCWRNTGDRH